jgi:hypothetical protein
MEKLKQDYEMAVNAYLKAFCKKHDYEYDPDYWVAGDVGGVIMIGDIFVNFTDMRVDIDNNALQGEFMEWYEYCLRMNNISGEIQTPDYKEWLMCCNIKGEGEILELERLHQRVEDATEKFMDAIRAFNKI